MQALAIKRNRLEVLTEILQVCKSPQTKTRILHKANLSYVTLQDCLAELQELSFVEVLPNLNRYLITEKGKHFLGKWMQLQGLLTPKERVLIKREKKLTTTNSSYSVNK